MKLLFAVISYQGDAQNGNNQLIRETWGKDIQGADLRFFIGRRSTTFSQADDEELADFQRSRNCQHAWWESYKDCCQDFWQVQVRSMLAWSISRGYDFTYLCSTDTFVVPQLLMKTGFCLRAGFGEGKKCLGRRFGTAARGRVSKHLQRPRIRACADEFGGPFASEELVLSHPDLDHLFNRFDVVGFQAATLRSLT